MVHVKRSKYQHNKCLKEVDFNPHRWLFVSVEEGTDFGNDKGTIIRSGA